MVQKKASHLSFRVRLGRRAAATKIRLPDLFSLSLLALSCWLMVGAAPVSAAEPTDHPLTIIALGDSITKGVREGVTAEQTFAALMEEELRHEIPSVRVVNEGIGGERTDQAIQRLPQILELHPHLVTVMYGTNDSYIDPGASASRLTVDQYRANLERIVTELLRHGVLPVLMTEPRWSDDATADGRGENPNVPLEPFMVACRETAAKWRVPLVDHFEHWTKAREQGTNLRDWTTDGCHPNPAGHRELADLIVALVRRALGPDSALRKNLQAGHPSRVVCFGDSVTGIYYHTGSRRAYPEMLELVLRRIAPQADIHVINAGVSGNTTVDALNRIEGDVIAHHPDLVTVMFGLNDMTRVSLDDYRANIKSIVTKCRDTGIEVVLVTPNNVIDTGTRPTEKLIQYCDALRELGTELQIPVCDIYQEFDAVRAHDAFQWRLLMSDEIHPNMDGHKRIAAAIANKITRMRVSLDDTRPLSPLSQTQALLRGGKPIQVLAMPPLDQLIGPALREFDAGAQINVESWNVERLSLAQIEQDAKQRVREMKPDLVLIAVPDSATADSDEQFVASYTWMMNWSLNFGPPTWDCIVLHPAVSRAPNSVNSHDELIRQLVRAQDLTLIDRPKESQKDTGTIFKEWLQQALHESAN